MTERDSDNTGPANLSKKLRLRAVELYGAEKYALSKAFADAVEEWLKQPSHKK